MRPYTDAVVAKSARVLAFCLATLLLPTPARTEHEVFYRYVALGYVKDASGAALAGVGVELIRDRTGFSYLAETDAHGFYVIVARLGDESAGERLTVKAGFVAAAITARFDPGNHTDHRGTRLDFVGSRAEERSSWFAATLQHFLAE